jgi:hypothetical protein
VSVTCRRASRVASSTPCLWCARPARVSTVGGRGCPGGPALQTAGVGWSCSGARGARRCCVAPSATATCAWSRSSPTRPSPTFATSPRRAEPGKPRPHPTLVHGAGRDHRDRTVLCCPDQRQIKDRLPCQSWKRPGRRTRAVRLPHARDPHDDAREPAAPVRRQEAGACAGHNTSAAA